jgi:O-antigen/teichoic acid export membrane protein
MQVASKPNPTKLNQHAFIAAKRGGVTFAGKLFENITVFASSVMVARLLGAEQNGLYKLAVTLSTMISALCHLGLDGGIVRYLPMALAERNATKIPGIIQIGAGIPIFISLIVTSLLLLLAEPLADQVLGKPTILPVLHVVAFAIPLGVLNHCLAAIAQGFKQVQYTAYAQDIAANSIKLTLSLIVLVLGYGVIGLAAVYVISLMVAVGMLFYFVHRLFPLTQALKVTKRNTREILNYSLPLYIQRLLNIYGRNFEILVLGYFGLLSDVGIYAVILPLSKIGNMAFGSLREIAAPIIAELHSQGKHKELEQFYQTITKWALTFNLPIFLTIVLFPTALLSVFGKEFTGGTTGLIILSTGVLFDVATGMCGTVINMTGYSRVGLLNSIVYLGTTLLLDFILIPRWYLLGAAMAGAVTIIINNTLRVIEAYVLINGLLPFNRSFLKPVMAAALAAGLTYWLSDLVFIDRPILQLLVLGPTMWLVYAAAILAQKLSDEDRMIITAIRSRKKLKAKALTSSGNTQSVD